MSAVDNAALSSELGDENKEGMFAVNFVNPDGTPYAPDGLTKVTWGGSYAEYPYGTPVDTNWQSFCTTGETVKLSGGDQTETTLSSYGQTYNITNSIGHNYTITVTKTSAPVVTTGTLEITVDADGLYNVTVTISGGITGTISAGMTSDGQKTLTLDPGTYNYHVVARGYTEQTGGMEKELSCNPSGGSVTITAGATKYLSISVSSGDIPN